MNFTQFCTKNGYCNDYNVLDHGDLSPSGRVSKRSREASLARMRKRIASNNNGHIAYQEAIDSGKFSDPNGKVLPTPKTETPEYKKCESRIMQLESIIKIWESVGISIKTGKLRPSYKKQIGNAKLEIAGFKSEMQNI